MLRAHPAMEEEPTEPPFRFVQWDGKVIRETMRLRFKPGIDPDGVTFETGYDRAAIQSYAVFSRLRREGAIPSHLRFPVSLPTPMASGYMYVSPKAREAYLRVYEHALLAALRQVVAAIPAEDLAIRNGGRLPETRLYLGLIHFDDRVDDAERIAAAHRVIGDFGIASECGWGRTDPTRLMGLLASHRDAAAALP